MADVTRGGATPRIPLPGRDAMSAEQREVHDLIVNGRRGALVGPLRAAILNPELARRWSALGELLRFGTSLPKRVSELAVLATARRWTSQVEFLVHARAAAAAGVSDTAIEAIRQGRAPALPGDEADAYDFTRHLLQTGQVPLPAYRAAETRWGAAGVVELTALVGYYSMVAMTLNAHDIPVPQGDTPPLDRLPGDMLPNLPDPAR